jgi:hypothetical protein
MADIKRVFTKTFIEQRKISTQLTSLPVFILGMPRSGSTLIEQILASHPAVSTIGESNAFRDALRSFGLDTRALPFPGSVPDWSRSQLQDAATQYIDRLSALSATPDQQKPIAHIVNKMLNNFRHIGLIYQMFPRARIIHARRDAVDTCMSCFYINFAKVPFSFDLGELGRYYKAYSDLMNYWHQVLPPGTILDVQHEQLVSNFEEEVRRILAYCEIDWDASCLRYYEGRLPVRTASVIQVRQPLFQSSTPRWRPDAHSLRPLVAEL